MNINGSFTALDIITISAGTSVGIAEKSTPKVENSKVASTNIPRSTVKLLGVMPSNKPYKTGRSEKLNPKSIEASISPIKILVMVIGLAKSISRVFCLVSHGRIMGVTAEEVKKVVIAIKGAIPSLTSKPLPI